MIGISHWNKLNLNFGFIIDITNVYDEQLGVIKFLGLFLVTHNTEKYMYIIISQTFFLSLVATFISRGSFFVCMSGLTLATFTTFLLVYVVVYIECLQLRKRGWFWIPCGLSDKWDEFCSNVGITKEKVWQLCEQYQYPLFLFFVFKG